ncbi:MAG: hypothetical protein ACE5G1_16910, partial [bacterium]
TTTKGKSTGRVEKTVTSIGKNNMPASQLDSPRLHLNEHLSPRPAAQLLNYLNNPESSTVI